MGYRIEALQPGVVDHVRKHGSLTVNGFRFFPLEDGRVVSDPVPEAAIPTFDVPGYLLVREEPPYERVAPLGQWASRTEEEKALEGNPPGAEGPATPPADDLASLTKAQLLALAQERGLKVSDRATKDEIIKALKADEPS